MNILDYVTVTNVIDKNVCEQVIKLTEEKTWKKHEWTYTKDRFEQSSHKDKELDIQHTEQNIHELINPLIETATHMYLDSLKQDNVNTTDDVVWIVSEFTSPRMNKYGVGTKMRKHYDHIHSVFKDRKGIPVLSIVGLLNDNFEGGKFMCRDVDLNLKQGDIVIMPSVFLFPHEVTEITKGTRYSFVAWAF